MAVLVPFRALRPAPAVAACVAAVPYDVVTTDEARALAAGNPLSFLHVSRAEIDLPAGTDPYADEVYAKAAVNFARLRREAPLVEEEAPRLYVYRLAVGSHVQTGVAGCFSLDEYVRGVIRKHERTRRDKEDDRTRHMLALRAQTGPVFLAYRRAASIQAIVARTTDGAALYDFEADDGVRHTVWHVDPADEPALVAAFGDVPALYIADGHHRAASAARAREALRRAGDPSREADTFLAVAFPDTDLRVLPYNRVVRDLNGATPGSFLDALRTRFEVSEGGPTPARRGDVSMYLAGRWYSIALGPPSSGAPLFSRLDVSRLQDGILGPLLGIEDPRTDARIDFVGGARGTRELERLVNSGAAAVAFAMYPVSIAELMAICDAGGIMPPKSTWFEPKLRDGLLSHLL